MYVAVSTQWVLTSFELHPRFCVQATSSIACGCDETRFCLTGSGLQPF